MAYPYTPAFVAFLGGTPAEEIAEEFDIPLKSLLAKIRQEGWRGLANRIAGRITADWTPHEDAFAKIDANRAQNYDTAAKLREHLNEIVAALRAGTLRIKRQFQQKGQITEYEAPLGPSDWLSLATYARTIADMTYRALGDVQAQQKPGQDAPTGAKAPPAPPVTIVLPAAIALPRGERSVEVECLPVQQANGSAATPPLLQAPAGA